MFEKIKNLLTSGHFISNAERLAVQTFKKDLPKARFSRTKIAAKENNRIVVGVFYGDTKPLRCRFYAVANDLRSVSLVRDDSVYAPKMWR